MSSFRDDISANTDDLLNPKVCVEPYYWSFIAESLGIDHRLLANPTIREEISEYLKNIAMYHFPVYCKDVSSKDNTDQEQLAIVNNVKRSLKPIDIKLVKLMESPKLIFNIIKHVLDTEEKTTSRVEAYGLSILSKTGTVTIEINNPKYSQAGVSTHSRANTDVFTRISYRIDSRNGKIIRRTEQYRNGEIEEAREDTYDEYGNVQRTESKKKDKLIITERDPKWPFTAVVKEYELHRIVESGTEILSGDLREQDMGKIIRSSRLGINRKELNTLNLFQSFDGLEILQPLADDEEGLRNEFERHKEEFARTQNKGVQKLFVDAGLLTWENFEKIEK